MAHGQAGFDVPDSWGLAGKVAIVTGVQTLVGSAKGYVPGPRRMTDIFARRNGEWQQIGGQTTIVK